MPRPHATRFSVPPPASTAPPVLPAQHYCPRCGAPWNALWMECPACAAGSRENRAAERGALSSLLAEPHKFRPTQSSVISALALYFALLAVSIIGLIILRLGNPGVSFGLVIGGIDSVIVIAWCIATQKDMLPTLRVSPPWPWYVVAVAGALFTFSVAYAMIGLLHVLVNMSVSHYSDSALSHKFGWPVLILTVCLQPAVIEELAFRGIIFSGMRQTLGPIETVLVTAGMFTILHLSVPSIPHLFTIGVALGYLRLRTGSVYPGMALHFTHNLLCILSEQYGS